MTVSTPTPAGGLPSVPPDRPLGDERVLVVGAGSLGSVYGGYLARAGLAVQLYTRDAHAAAVTEAGGLAVTGPDGAFHAPLRATADPAEVAPAEIVIVLCKTPDTATVLAELDHLRGTPQVAVSLQNGVDADGVLAAWAGADRVLGGVSMVGGTLDAPGRVTHTLAGPTFLGEPDGRSTARLARLAALLDTAGLPVEVTDRIASVEWSKLIHASPSMALTALTRRWFHEVFLAPELATLFLDLVLEGVAVARAEGVEVDDWPSLLPLRTLASLPREEALDRIDAHGRRLVAHGATQIRISMLQSVERGRRTEVEALHGVVVRVAARHGLPVPVTDTCYRLLAGLDRYAD